MRKKKEKRKKVSGETYHEMLESYHCSEGTQQLQQEQRSYILL